MSGHGPRTARFACQDCGHESTARLTTCPTCRGDFRMVPVEKLVTSIDPSPAASSIEGGQDHA